MTAHKITAEEAAAAMEAHGSQRAAAAALGVAQSTVHAALHREPEFMVTKRTTLYGPEGQLLEWVHKARIKQAEQEQWQDAIIERLREELPKPLPVLAPATAGPGETFSLYPVGDPHMGMLTWGKEVGADYDLKIAAQLHLDVVSRLVEGAPSGPAVIAFMGDTMHYDSFETITPKSKNQLDSDSRYSKVAWRTVELIRTMVGITLQHHDTVEVIVIPGNHDPSSSVFLELTIKIAFENEPRVRVLTSPNLFRYVAHGQVLLGFTHGHTVKLDRLPILMAADQPGAWGASRFRYWWTGHIHQRRVLDAPGVVVESLRTLAPGDAWAHGDGYRPHRVGLRVDYHMQGGEMGRRLVTPEML